MKTVLSIQLPRLLLIGMWTYAGLSKLLDYGGFRFALLGHRLIESHLYLVAWLVPAIEVMIALLLLFRRTVVAGFVVSAIFLVALTAYIFYLFAYYPHLPCSCGGLIGLLSWRQHIVFNGVFIILSLTGWRQSRRYS